MNGALRVGGLALALLAVLALAGLGFVLAQHWVAIHTGTTQTFCGSSACPTQPWYNFWSGFGSDIGEVTLAAGAVAVFRHRNCHTKGCWRIGKQVEGTPYLACHKHHPAHTAATRNITEGEIHAAYHRARGTTP